MFIVLKHTPINSKTRQASLSEIILQWSLHFFQSCMYVVLDLHVLNDWAAGFWCFHKDLKAYSGPLKHTLSIKSSVPFRQSGLWSPDEIWSERSDGSEPVIGTRESVKHWVIRVNRFNVRVLMLIHQNTLTKRGFAVVCHHYRPCESKQGLYE